MTYTKQELIDWYEKTLSNGKGIRNMPDDKQNALGYDILNLANAVDFALQEKDESRNNHSKLYHIRKTADRMHEASKIKKSEKAEHNKETEFLFGYYFKDIKSLINEFKSTN